MRTVPLAWLIAFLVTFWIQTRSSASLFGFTVRLLIWMTAPRLPAGDPELSALVRAQFDQALREELIVALFDRAVARGELGPDRPSSRVLGLPVNLLRHDLLIYGEVGDEKIVSIVDEAFLPLLSASAPSF